MHIDVAFAKMIVADTHLAGGQLPRLALPGEPSIQVKDVLPVELQTTPRVAHTLEQSPSERSTYSPTG